MNEVQLLKKKNHEVRSLLLNNEPWFVGKDVAEHWDIARLEMPLQPILIVKIKRTPQFRAPLAVFRK